jgi:hypothetical protein
MGFLWDSMSSATGFQCFLKGISIIHDKDERVIFEKKIFYLILVWGFNNVTCRCKPKGRMRLCKFGDAVRRDKTRNKSNHLLMGEYSLISHYSI